MVTTSRGHEVIREQPLGLRWLPFVNRAVFLRSAIVAVVIGSALTLINQSGWVVGSDPLQLLPFILVFVTPFVVVTISQVVAVRRAFIDAVRHGAPASPEGFIATTISHGIPARAVAIGLIIGSINAIMILAGALLRSGDLAAVSVALLGQVYALPLTFGVLSQAISYRRVLVQRYWTLENVTFSVVSVRFRKFKYRWTSTAMYKNRWTSTDNADFRQKGVLTG